MRSRRLAHARRAVGAVSADDLASAAAALHLTVATVARLHASGALRSLAPHDVQAFRAARDRQQAALAAAVDDALRAGEPLGPPAWLSSDDPDGQSPDLEPPPPRPSPRRSSRESEEHPDQHAGCAQRMDRTPPGRRL
jgi:hypothetical protein